MVKVRARCHSVKNVKPVVVYCLFIRPPMKVGNHNALSGDTAPGRTRSSIDGEYSTDWLRGWAVGKVQRTRLRISWFVYLARAIHHLSWWW